MDRQLCTGEYCVSPNKCPGALQFTGSLNDVPVIAAWKYKIIFILKCRKRKSKGDNPSTSNIPLA